MESPIVSNAGLPAERSALEPRIAHTCRAGPILCTTTWRASLTPIEHFRPTKKGAIFQDLDWPRIRESKPSPQVSLDTSHGHNFMGQMISLKCRWAVVEL